MKQNEEINQQSLIDELIKKSDYEDPEIVSRKTNGILNLLKNSKDENLKNKYLELMDKIKEKSSLKPIFDFFFKEKKEQRLKLFMSFQMQERETIKRLLENKKKKEKKAEEEKKEKKEERKLEIERKKESDAELLLHLLYGHEEKEPNFMFKTSEAITPSSVNSTIEIPKLYREHLNTYDTSTQKEIVQRYERMMLKTNQKTFDANKFEEAIEFVNMQQFFGNNLKPKENENDRHM